MAEHSVSILAQADVWHGLPRAPRRWCGMGAALVEAAAKSAAEGGGSRKVVAAAVAAACRCVAASAQPAQSGGDGVKELAVRPAEMAPAMLQRIRGQWPDGQARSRRNVGAHWRLGEAGLPIEQLEEALLDPQRSQRGARQHVQDMVEKSDVKDGAAEGSTESGSASETEDKPLSELMKQVSGEEVQQESDGKCVKLAMVLAIPASEVAQLKAQLAMATKAESGEEVQEGIDNPVKMKVNPEIGEAAQEGIGNPILSKVKREPPKKCKELKEPHYEDGDKEETAILAESHEFEGKQQERGVAWAMQTEIGEEVQHGIDSPIMMKVQIETPTKYTAPKEPHFEDGDKKKIENHEFDGKSWNSGASSRGPGASCRARRGRGRRPSSRGTSSTSLRAWTSPRPPSSTSPSGWQPGARRGRPGPRRPPGPSLPSS
ncbi:unnamed protein product [Prorocentrum cordatum]|uniref:Uncharacterized protein n=1 Tax=Prorocentrum cordatum TaxID=2364126 RepID=A0ABN9V1P2_9DINO|nr:unnamed protein product [Polarella glacialis]